VADALAVSPVTVKVEVVLAIEPADVDIVYPAVASKLLITTVNKALPAEAVARTGVSTFKTPRRFVAI
jgi:hypothetical protein